MTVTSRLETKPRESPEREVYSNPQARKILQFMLRSPRTPVGPDIAVTDDIRYPELKPVVELNEADTLDLLSRMVEAKVLLADLVDKAPACPECGSYQLSTRYVCPKCFSFNIERSFLYEHLKCGKVAGNDTFKKGDQLICPKCQTVLHNYGVEYRAVGAWYKCGNCTESFNSPSHSHFCRQKRHQFTADRARLIPIYQYRLNPDTLSITRREVLMYSDVITTLEALGLKVQAPSQLLGKSGQPQLFDIVATVDKGRWGRSKTIAIDAVKSEPGVSVDAVRNFASKVREAKLSESYLITVPKLTDEAKVLAKNLKMTFVEGASLKEATTALLALRTFKDLTPSQTG